MAVFQLGMGCKRAGRELEGNVTEGSGWKGSGWHVTHGVAPAQLFDESGEI